MKIRIKHWLIGCVILGLPLALFQRLLRDPDFMRGFWGSLYWLFWLCYADQRLEDPTHNALEAAGVFLGMVLQILLLSFSILLGPPICWMLAQKKQDGS